LYFSFLTADTESIDVWSLGVLMHVMLTGISPFEENSPDGVCAGFCVKPELQEFGISNPAVELIQQMLALEPGSRPTPEDIREHPWVKRLLPQDWDGWGPDATSRYFNTGYHTNPFAVPGLYW
jgi:serine/threonine protein kinase